MALIWMVQTKPDFVFPNQVSWQWNQLVFGNNPIIGNPKLISEDLGGSNGNDIDFQTGKNDAGDDYVRNNKKR